MCAQNPNFPSPGESRAECATLLHSEPPLIRIRPTHIAGLQALCERPVEQDPTTDCVRSDAALHSANPSKEKHRPGWIRICHFLAPEQVPVHSVRLLGPNPPDRSKRAREKIPPPPTTAFC